MFTVKVNEQANGFTAMTADELFFINGGSGSTPQLDQVIAQQNSNNTSSEQNNSQSQSQSQGHHTVEASAKATVFVIPGLPPITIITGEVKYKYEK